MTNSIHACTENMIRVWQSLRSTWEATRDSWKDTDRDQFEREHIYEISQATNEYIANLKQLADSVQRIMNEAP